MPGNRAADQLARRLAEAGCRHAFGIPGGEVLTLMDALAEAGITYVTAKHETAAGFMAEGIWQRTGTPPVLVATVGPGVSNAVNVVANARLDRVPLIVLAGAVDADDALTYNHQIIDHTRLLEPAIKGAFTLTATAADLITEKALALIDLKQRERQLTRRGVGVGPFGVVDLARGLGGHGVVASDRRALETALEDALTADHFTLIACPIAADAYQGRL